MWNKVSEQLPNIGDRVKVVGRFTPDPVASGFLRAVYTGNTRNGLSGFRSNDYRAESAITDWCPVDMSYEDEEDWEWTAALPVADQHETQTTH